MRIDELRNRIPIDKVLEYMGSTLHGWHMGGGSGWVTAVCPFHDDTNPSMGVNLNTGRFRCHGCGRGGSIIDAALAHHGIEEGTETRDDLKRMMEWLEKTFLR